MKDVNLTRAYMKQTISSFCWIIMFLIGWNTHTCEWHLASMTDTCLAIVSNWSLSSPGGFSARHDWNWDSVWRSVMIRRKMTICVVDRVLLITGNICTGNAPDWMDISSNLFTACCNAFASCCKYTKWQCIYYCNCASGCLISYIIDEWLHVATV